MKLEKKQNTLTNIGAAFDPRPDLHSTNNFKSIYYTPDCLLSAEDITIKRTNKVPTPMELTF